MIAIDFDHTIHDAANPIKGRRMGPPMDGAKEAIEKLRQKHKIVIFTVWGDVKGRKTIADWMNYYKIPYDEITNIKPNATVFIDDRAIRFTSWEEVIHTIKDFPLDVV